MLPRFRAATRVSGPFLALLLLTSASYAEWPSDPMTNVPIFAGAGDQILPVIIPDEVGGSIILWHHFAGESDYDMYAQRVNGSGTLQWGPAGVPIVIAPNIQAGLFMIPDGSSGMFVGWQDERSGTSNSNIYVQHLNANGTPLWTANGVAVCTAVGQQYNAHLVSDGAGGVIVSWYDQRSGNFDIYAQRVNASGTPQWTPDGVALCTTGFDQFLNAMIADGSGGAILAWEHRGANSDIFVQRVNGAGVAQWTANGVALCTQAADQYAPYAVTDGVGGAIVVWLDERSGSMRDIYARRVSASGSPQWAANGIPVCTAANDQLGISLVSDEAGGAIATWYDNRTFSDMNIYAQRITHGALTPWTADGVILCGAAGQQQSPVLTADGQGGAIAAWVDSREGETSDIFAQRVDASGAVQLAVDGVAVCTALGTQDYPAIAMEEGGEGAVVVWSDGRNADLDIYAQRVDVSGVLADPAPVIVSVADVPRDQGGRVRVAWNRSHLDTSPFYQIESYVLWRQVELASGAEGLDPPMTSLPGRANLFQHRNRLIRVEPASAGATYWEFVERIPALGYPGYSYLAPTASDSMAAGNPLTVFQVDALADTDNTFWSSDPDSGYSVDNLAPGAPTGFRAIFQGANTFISWDENGDPDLYGYRLHRGATPDFVPGPENLIAALPLTEFDDPAGSPYYYKLAGVDVHENVGPFVTTYATGEGSVPDLGTMVVLSRAAPNPTRGSTTVQLATRMSGPVEMKVFDARGRLVQKARQNVTAGTHPLRWDGRSSTGEEVANGRYYIHVTAGDVDFHRSVVIVR